MKHFFRIGIFAFLAAFLASGSFAHADLVVSGSPNVCIVYSHYLHLGSRDARTNGEVSNLQLFLHARGYLKQNPSGHFNGATRRAVRLYQHDRGIPISGIVSVHTRAALMKDCGVTPAATAPFINAIVPATAHIGDTVTLYGSNFTPDAIVHFGIGGFLPTSISNTSVQFTVPSAVGPYCKPGQMCAMFMTSLVKGGTYPISIETASGTSNAVNLIIAEKQ